MGLEKLGFPWILSSESSLFNGLREIFSGIIFTPLSGREGGARPPFGRFDLLPMPPTQYGGPIVLMWASEVVSFNPCRSFAIPKPTMMRPPRASGKKMSIVQISRIRVKGDDGAIPTWSTPTCSRNGRPVWADLR